MGIQLEAAAFVKAACCSAACYAITKTCRYLCTRPVIEAGKVATIFDKFRQACASVQESIVRCVGERRWESFSEIIMDNMWISVFILSSFFFLAVTLPPCSEELIGKIAFVCAGVANISANVRYVLSQKYPDSNIVKTWIAPHWA